MQEVAAAVRAELQNYADRGIFQNFSVIESNSGSSVEYRFHWLAESPFRLKLNADKSELELKDVLPAVPYRSAMDRAFRDFLLARCDDSIPAHRRLDGERFNFTVRNRQQNLSVTIGFDPADSTVAAKTAVNLLHEIFNNFLQEGPYQNYMVEEFNVPEE
jgi:hypothetical protein